MYTHPLFTSDNRWSLSLFLLCIYWTLLNYTVYYIILYYITLYYIILYYNMLYILFLWVVDGCPCQLWDQMQTFLAFAKGVVHAETCQCAKLLWHNCRCNTKVFPRQSRALLETMHACHFSAAWVYHQPSRRYDKYTRLQPDIANTCPDLLGVFLMCCQL